MTAHSVRRLFPLFAATALAIASPAPAAASTCASCHQKLLATKGVHAGECQDCHKPQGPKGKCEGSPAGWALVALQPELCVRCHDVLNRGSKPHKPARLACTSCHDPHGGDQKAFLKRGPQDQLCYQCHAPFKNAPSLHTAVKQANCTGCHDAHSGVDSPLLVAPRTQLCDKCHDKAKLGPSRVQHAPFAEGDCLPCHDPHQAGNPKLLPAQGKALCATCHSTKAKLTAASPGPGFLIDLAAPKLHDPVAKGACQLCHVQTHSGEEMLLAKPPPELCYGCHNKRQDAHPYVHGAVKAGDCDGCHDPHGSGQDHLLREAKASALCFRCHDDDVTGRASVHKPVAEGKCLECHGAHGADYPMDLVRGVGKDACVSCHPDKGKAKVQHRELERHGCTGCHDPHGSDQPAELVKQVNDLCTGCHAKEKDGLHVTAAGASVQGGHPVSGAFDPRRAGRSFSCASCHDPHGSANPKLFYSGASEAEMCDGCHGDRSGKHPELKDIHKQKPAAAKVAPAQGSLAAVPGQGDRR